MGYAWGDGQVSASDLLKIYRALREEKTHLAKALRVERHDGLFRWVQTRCYAVVFAALFGRFLRDPNGCPKLFLREALEDLAPTAFDWLLDPEIMLKAGRMNLRITEVPVVFRKRRKGRSKVRGFTAAGFCLGLLRLRFGRERRERALPS